MAELDYTELERLNEAFDEEPEFGGPLSDGPEAWLMEHRREIVAALQQAEDDRLVKGEAIRLLRLALGRLRGHRDTSPLVDEADRFLKWEAPKVPPREGFLGADIRTIPRIGDICPWCCGSGRCPCEDCAKLDGDRACGPCEGSGRLLHPLPAGKEDLYPRPPMPGSERHEIRTDTPNWDTTQRCTCGFESRSKAEQWKHAADELRTRLDAAERLLRGRAGHLDDCAAWTFGDCNCEAVEVRRFLGIAEVSDSDDLPTTSEELDAMGRRRARLNG
jgi:hypothetical protein